MREISMRTSIEMKKDWPAMNKLERIWAWYKGEIPTRLANGEGAQLAKIIGASPSGVPGLVHDLRKHGLPEAAMAWRMEYQALRR